MTEPTRAKAGRRNRRSASQLLMAALVVFGVVASVLLLFSENVQWLRVGVASALWAAIIGAFAMTKYRRESVVDQTKTKDLQTVYELQLAREISARREYELGVEARVREQNKLETSEIAALRTELAALRSNLQVLFEGNLPTERIALRAEAVRLQELAGRSYEGYQPAPSGLYVPGGAPQPHPGAAGGGRVGASEFAQVEAESVDEAVSSHDGSGLATPFDEPVTAETSVIYPESGSVANPRNHRTADSSQQPSGDRADYTQQFRRVESERATEAASVGTAPAGAGSGVGGEEPRRPTPFTGYNYGESRPPRARTESTIPAPPEPTPEPEPVVPDPVSPEPVSPEPVTPDPEPQPDPMPTVYRGAAASSSFVEEEREADSSAPHRRRRRGEDASEESTSGAHSNGRSVADILAGMQSGDSEPSARRHRRRAE